MCYPRHFLLAVSLWLMIGSVSAQPNNYITVGKYRAHPTRVIAKYKDPNPVSIQSTANTLSTLGVVVKDRFDLVPGLVVLEPRATIALQSVQALDPQVQAQALVTRIATLEDSGLFEYVQPSYVYTNHIEAPTDPAYSDGSLWGLVNDGKNSGVIGADIDAKRAWDITTGTNSVIVAVIDTGVRYTHADLAPQMWRNPTETAGNGSDDDADGVVDDIYGINAVGGTGDPNDDYGHGTHVAGTIGAKANGGGSSVGVAWNVQIMACKFLDSSGVGLTDDAIRCIDYAVAHGAKVLNNSWGGGPYERALFDSISAAQKKNVLFIASAGNDGSNNDVFPAYPASYNLNNVISVGASDRADQFASFSNYGRTNVDVVGPGVDVFSTAYDSDNSYVVMSGTSMAAPHVSGVAALVLAKFPKATLAELRERLISTAVKVPAFRGLAVSEGRLSAYRALSAAADGIMEMSVYPPPGNDLLAGQKVSIFVTVSDLRPVTNATVQATYVVGTTTNTLKFLNDGVSPDLTANDGTYSADLTVPNLLGDLPLNFTITAAGKTNLSEVVVYHIAQRPPNDNFENASKVQSKGGLVLGTNRFATLQLSEPKHAGVPSVDASVWWNWSPSSSGPVIVDTAGSSFDTVLAVYTNSSLKTLHEIASVDDVGTKGAQKQGYVQFNATAGLTYRIAVAGFSSPDVGEIRLRVEQGGKPDTNAPTVIVNAPSSGLVVTNADGKIDVQGVAYDPEPNASGVKEVFVQLNGAVAEKVTGTTNWIKSGLLLAKGQNSIRVLAVDYAGNRSEARNLTVTYAPGSSGNDLFRNALELTNTKGTLNASSTNATKEVNEPFHAGNEGGKSLWWFFRATADGVLTLNTKSSTFDTLLAAYTGSKVDSLTLVGSNDDATDGSGYSLLNQAVQAGQIYFIAVDGYAGSSGTVTLAYSFAATGVWHVDVQTPDGGSVSPSSGLYPGGTNLVFTAVPGAGQDFDRWEGSLTSTDNPLTVTASSDMTLVARFRVHEPTNGFESGTFSDLPWESIGVPWVVQSTTVASGHYAARSGVIGNGQFSSLMLRNLSLAAGTASFDFKVSSESKWDFLEFYLNGRRLDRWSGEVGWLTFRFDVAAGPNSFEWRYVKDPVNTTVGLDAAFIDNLELPAQESSASAPASVQLNRLADGQIELSVQGEGNGTYVIQVSTDLIHWSNLSSAKAVGATTTVLDPGSSQQKTRFYRVITVDGN